MISLRLVGSAIGVCLATTFDVGAQQPVRVPADQPARIGAFEFPAQFDGGRRLTVLAYETPGMGHSIGYGRGAVTMTMYVYDLGRKAIPNDPNDDVVVEEYYRSLDEALQFTNATLKVQFVLPDERKVERLNCAWLTYNADKGGNLCVGTANDKFIKFRTSAPETRTGLAESILFIRSWMPIFWPPT